MCRYLPLLLFIGLVFWGCEEEVDNTPPTVTITSPQDGSTVNEVVTITCIFSDNEDVENVKYKPSCDTNYISNEKDDKGKYISYYDKS